MLNKMKTTYPTRINTIIVVLVVSLIPVLNGCVESTFLLSKDSRLPKWVNLPEGYSREDVSVSLFLFTIGKASLIVRGPKPERKTLMHLRIKADWHESSLKKVKQLNSHAFKPHYYLASYEDVEDIIEFPCFGPVFRMVDKIEQNFNINSEECEEIDYQEIGNPW